MSQNVKTLISFKTDKSLRDEAKEVAKELGIPLSTAFNAFLKQFVRDKAIVLSSNDQPNPFLIACVHEARKDYQAGNTEGSFSSADDFLAALKA